ncbi:trypsin-like peptidase domain-containing protein [Aureibaculum sp. 2210JD6-5]|uniref:S1C family serine protease n=1 Tax=Aureibaculum sp. 2210JD6-5 TaxID=3103957 RepID=UPI002AAE6845|nr:trypsin-like peptidase domain-containing protein [Aureibaculum sp. 2210JD6-5]MDY7393730.1 trypsin-like peptidase domain-containing protein [Aureibaculum sp. 2210JD6-5]
MKKIISLVFASILGGAIALGTYVYVIGNTEIINNTETANQPKVVQANYTIPSSSYAAEATDFTKAAEETVHAVVHVKNVSVSRSNPLVEFFYGADAGGGGKTTIGTGSGVIISPDGYIITNNHVIRGAKELEITLNNQRSYPAEVIGADPTTDIALIKISGEDLPFVSFANSDNVKVGEWVLAVGNPFNLTSTVTAGIVSAKARNINISGGRMIESFIQTDAAVNPGNSGGALVNVRGELVGINTAITSQTGSYVGYSFAVPSNIAKKVIEDLMEFGDVRAAYLGINPAELNAKVVKELDLNQTQGVLVADVTKNGGAIKAGIEKNDIIVQIDQIKINKFSDLKGFLSTKRPGDVVNVTVLRNDKEKEFEVKLSNQFGKETIDKLDFSKNLLGNLEKISKKEAAKYRINYGLQLKSVKSPFLLEEGVKPGNIILKLAEEKVYDVQDAEDILRKNKGEWIIVQILNSEGYVEYPRIYVSN